MVNLVLPKLKCVEAVPTRFPLWMMMFSACWVSYMLRVNMSVNIIAMVNSSNHQNTKELTNASGVCQRDHAVFINNSIEQDGTTDIQVLKGPTFDWSSNAQGLILSSYFWGYLTTILGGPAAERWGPRRVIGYTTLGSAVLTALSVPAAHLHWGVLVAVRILLGFLAGLTFPALHTLIATWIPPAEKGKFTSSLQGGVLGTVATWSLSGVLIDTYGWEAAFYIPAVVSFVWCFLWFYLIYDAPAEHPRISLEEKRYLEGELGSKLGKEKVMPPLKSMFTSTPYLAMVVLHFGNMWGMYFIMTAAPMFMSSVLNFNLKAAGILSALPYLARLILAFAFGMIGDYIMKRKLLTTTMIRKSFCLFSHIIPGLMLVSLVFAGCDRTIIVTLLTLSTGWNGAATLTNLANHQDLAPNFAGTLYGIANFVGTFTGFISPLVVAYFTKEKNGMEEWKPVFFIGASIYILCAIIFVLFGTGEIQEWNFVAKKETPNENLDVEKCSDKISPTIVTIPPVIEDTDKTR